MKIKVFFLIFLSASSLVAFETPQTLYTDNKYYITFGEVDFDKPIDEIAIILLKYNDYAKWALDGMQGIDKESEGLIAYFTNIEYSSEQDSFIVSFDINLVWPFGSKDNKINFRPAQMFDDNGELVSISLIPEEEIKMLKEVIIEIGVKEREDKTTSVNYLAKIKFSGFLDFCFNLKSYKKNFEWYIFKLTDNLTKYLRAG